MNVKILYDNHARPGFESGWGFAALVDGSTLFDTGENAASLLANMQAFGVEPGQIERLVLSHDDWDHIGGMAILKMCSAVDVYVPASMSQKTVAGVAELNGECGLTRVAEGMEISSGLALVGELGDDKKEISLVARAGDGFVLVTGCAHPGLDRIMAEAEVYGRISAVVGGFHDFRRLGALSKVPLIVPCHCTKMKKEILSMYPEQAREVAAGVQLEL